MFVCDIGGGSTEVVVGNGDEMLLARSFKIGAVRLTDRFFGSATLHPSAVPSCRAFVKSTLMILQSEVQALGYDLAVCSSGTAETVARIIQQKSGKPEPTSMNRFHFTAQDVAEVVEDLTGCATVEERREKFSIDQKRAEIILAGAIILEAIADTYGISTFTFSDYALREGVLIDTLHRRGIGPENSAGDASLRSVKLLAERCDDRPEHSENVARIAVTLFDALASHLISDSDDRRLLEYAALLANVGVVISHSKHHLHSYYVIRNSELVGLADHDIEIIAQVARYHRKGLPKNEHPEFARLGDADKHRVELLAGILRVAVGLDRTQDGRVKKVKTQITDDEVLISFAPSKKLDNELNVYSAMERRSLLERVMNRRVRVTTD
jgi:exopolyphosphatase/guanosine-5'-triphosphate,3'-diphosphate pyrophosphatase